MEWQNSKSNKQTINNMERIVRKIHQNGIVNVVEVLLQEGEPVDEIHYSYDEVSKFG